MPAGQYVSPKPKAVNNIVWWGEHAIELFGGVVSEQVSEWLRFAYAATRDPKKNPAKIKS